MANKAERFVLRQDIIPTLYRLSIEPDLEQFTFKGSQQVEFKFVQKTHVVKMNAKDINVSMCRAVLQNGKKCNATISYEPDDEYVVFTFSEEIDAQGLFEMEWVGQLNDKLVGFYRSKYTASGESRFCAVTQMEPNDARRVLPCFDEPNVKAQFDVTLVVPEDRIALSNMQVVSEQLVVPVVKDSSTSSDVKDSSTSSGVKELNNENEKKKKKKRVQFARTPPMSTYLLAMVVGEFDYLEGFTSTGLKMRVYTLPGKTEQGKFALEVAIKVLPFFEDYFGQKFPLAKMDMIAIPDFAAGAMENWGLITYRETALLVDAQNSSAASKQWVALVVAHELSHQWFGNLVSPDFWNYLWLNEGFATWVEFFAVDHLFPEWKIFEQFVHDDFCRAQALDALVSSHPIEVPIVRASEVDEIFDAISYSKGCAVIRMLVEYMGISDFRKGLNVYLERHKFACATSDDLWDALGEASGKEIRSMMTTWTRQTGYPVITVSVEKVEHGKRFLTVEQYRYLDSGKPQHDDTLWIVPFGYITSADPNKPVYMLLTQRKQVIQVDDSIKWIKFNTSQVGFYRVQYPQEYYKELSLAVTDRSMPPIDRLGLLEDVVALARAGYLPSNNALQLLSAYHNEDNYTVLSSVASNIDAYWNILKHEKCAPQFKAFARQIFKKKSNELGWDPSDKESHLTSMLRPLVLTRLGLFGDEETVEQAKHKFGQQDHTLIPADLRSVVYVLVVANGTKSEYDKLLAIFRSTDFNEEKNRCLRSLGMTKDIALLKDTLAFSLGSEVRSQDIMYVLRTVAANPQGTQLAWQWLVDNLEEIKKRYEGGFILGNIIKICTGSLTAKEDCERAEKFFETNVIPNAQRSIAQALETIRLHSKWLNRDRSVIEQFLANF